MQTIKEKSFDTLVEQFLGKGLPPQLSGTISMSKLPNDTREFILRLLTLMKQAGYSTAQFSPVLIWWLSMNIPNMLPSAWGGLIPPITIPNRHKKLDDYVAKVGWSSGKTTPVFVDIGCGFPPVTTVDTAQRFPEWQVIGIDRFFAEYVLYNDNKQYACYDQEKVFQYFQTLPGSTAPGFYSAPEETKIMFNQQFSDLFPLLKNLKNGGSETVEKDGNRLIHNHIRDFEINNLRFIKSKTLNLKLPKVKVCRIMNMLIYFKPDIRKQILDQAGLLLGDDGMIIAGTNGLGAQSRYTVYKKKGDDIVPSQFAFSLDNLGHLAVMPWFTIHDNDPEAMLLAKYIRTIRSDKSFWPDFSNRLDQLLKEHGVCQRKTDGYLHFPEEIMPLDESLKKGALIRHELQEDGYAGNAADILVKADFNAWENQVGDIAVRP